MFQCTFRKTSWVRISTQKHSVVQRGRNLSPALVLPTCSAQLAVHLSPQACSAASSSSCRPVRGARRSHPGVLPEDKVWGGFLQIPQAGGCNFAPAVDLVAPRERCRLSASREQRPPRSGRSKRTTGALLRGCMAQRHAWSGSGRPWRPGGGRQRLYTAGAEGAGIKT